MKDKLVTVVIPTYNRAYILERTIPSYIQENVGEVIIIDDASTDNTTAIIQKLIKKYPIIRYYRQKENTKQPAAQNTALKKVKYPYVYFGDDDSFVLPNTIRYLLETMKDKQANIVGAMPLYADSECDFSDINKFIERKAPMLKDIKKKINLYHLEKINFFWRYSEAIEVPFTHACALVEKKYTDKILFDTNFKGNAYREETDFFLSCAQAGAKIYFDSRAVQINYPFSSIKRIRTFKSMFRHGYYDILNTIKLINKHYWWFVKKYNYKYSKNRMIIYYIINDCVKYIKIFPGRIYGIIKRYLNNANIY